MSYPYPWIIKPGDLIHYRVQVITFARADGGKQKSRFEERFYLALGEPEEFSNRPDVVKLKVLECEEGKIRRITLDPAHMSVIQRGQHGN